ncbi:MAG: M20/M25/M40 family metallo-hydrolase [Sphaerochaetaceae bacterium]
MLSEQVKTYIADHSDEAFELLKELAAIPAPSNHEEKRAEFIKAWLEKQGAKGVFIDEALNVVYPINCMEDNPLVVAMAHQDVVFPDTTPLPVTVADGKIMAPGVGDDTANLVALMMVMKYIAETKVAPLDGIGVLLVANTGEEGLGNLKGSRKICETYGPRIKEFVSFDGGSDFLTNKAVGSKRYKVTVETEGGHSYGAFGNRNAIAYLASMINTFYSMKVPTTGKTTYNVGLISGGTSVNTIAQKAEMLYEYRSDEAVDLAVMETQFNAVIEAYRAMLIKVSVETVGERPCSGAVEEAKLAALTEKAQAILQEYAGKVAEPHPGSTDCNIPLSLGIPSVCLGCYIGGGTHTYEEWLLVDSLKPGYNIAFSMVLSHFKG